jgi:hypothetical protein
VHREWALSPPIQKATSARHYGEIASKYYDYKVAVIDLRNPTKSDGNNLLHLVNKSWILWKKEPDNLAYKAKLG